MLVHFHTAGLDHPFFRGHFRQPPDGFEYVSPDLSVNATGMKRDYRLTPRSSFRIRRWIKDQLVMPAIRSLRLPRATYFSPNTGELVHTRIPLVNPAPYVLEVEDVSSLCFYSQPMLESRMGRSLLRKLLLSSHCKAVMPWTQAARRSLAHVLPDAELAEKTEVVYPAISPRITHRANRTDEIRRLLFVGSGYYHAGFYLKGGLETLRAFRLVREEFDGPVEIDLVCFAPPEVRAEYASEPGVRFHTGLSSHQLDRLFASADAVVVPTHVDSLGYVLLEACSWGVPCVSTRMFAVPEIIQDDVSGFTVPSPYNYFDKDGLPAFAPPRSMRHPLVRRAMNPPGTYVEVLADRMLDLLRDENRRLRIAQAALEQTRTGKFSFGVRNAALKRIYSAAFGSYHTQEVAA